MAEIIVVVTDEMAMAHVEGRKPRFSARIVKKIIELSKG